MKYFGEICFVTIVCLSISFTYYSIKENQVESGRVQKIETIEEPGKKSVFVTISGWAKNMNTYERRIEFDGPELPVIGQEVYLEKLNEPRLRIMLKKKSNEPL